MGRWHPTIDRVIRAADDGELDAPRPADPLFEAAYERVRAIPTSLPLDEAVAHEVWNARRAEDRRR